MADTQPEDTSAFRTDHVGARTIRRRKILLGLALLAGVVVVCIASIVLMLERLESRNASFQPPMTALERQRLLPQDPVLVASPKLEGLHYGDPPHVSKVGAPSGEEGHSAQDYMESTLLRSQDLHVEAYQVVRPTNPNR